jgi:hypothetical protein
VYLLDQHFSLARTPHEGSATEAARSEASAQPSLFYWKASAAVFPPNSMLVTLLLSTSTCEAAAFDGN